MTKDSAFTDEQRALWHRARRLGLESGLDYTSEELDEIEEDMKKPVDVDGTAFLGGTCIHCGAPLGEPVPEGYEGALCGVCD